MDSASPPLPWSLLLAGLLLIWFMARGAWRGFQQGPIRQCAGPFSLTIGLFLSWMYGKEFGFWALEETAFPWLLRGLVGSLFLGCASALFLYGVVWWLGKNSPKSDEADSPIFGAIVGCWTGMLYFSILVLLVITLATVIELWESEEKAKQSWIVSLRNNLADSPYTTWIKTWSPLPEKTLNLIQGIRAIAESTEVRDKLSKNQKIIELCQHPSLKIAIEDDEVVNLLKDNNLNKFINHPKVQMVLADEGLQRKFAQLEIERLILESFKATSP